MSAGPESATLHPAASPVPRDRGSHCLQVVDVSYAGNPSQNLADVYDRDDMKQILDSLPPPGPKIIRIYDFEAKLSQSQKELLLAHVSTYCPNHGLSGTFPYGDMRNLSSIYSQWEGNPKGYYRSWVKAENVMRGGSMFRYTTTTPHARLDLRSTHMVCIPSARDEFMGQQ